MMKSWAWASLQAVSISAWVASARPHSRFSRIVPEKRVFVLRHHADCAPQSVERVVAYVDAVHQDRPAGDVVQPRDQVHQGGFTRAGAADDADHLARLGREADLR